MKTATIHRPGTLPFVRFCGYFAVIAGLLGILAGLRLIDKNPNLAELLYVAIDLCSLFAILGWHLHQQNKVGSVGLAGFSSPLRAQDLLQDLLQRSSDSLHIRSAFL